MGKAPRLFLEGKRGLKCGLSGNLALLHASKAGLMGNRRSGNGRPPDWESLLDLSRNIYPLARPHWIAGVFFFFCVSWMPPGDISHLISRKGSVRVRNPRSRRGPNWSAGLQLGITTFVAACLVTLLAQEAMRGLSILGALMILMFITLAGIISDVVGVAVTVADEVPFHARASKRLRGARQSLWLVRNADRVAALANDVIGDLAGTISGAAVAVLTIRLALGMPEGYDRLVHIGGVALLAGLTVGGKAVGKGYALAHANEIVSGVGRLLALVQRKAR